MMFHHDGKIRYQGNGGWDVQFVSTPERPVFKASRPLQIMWVLDNLVSSIGFTLPTRETLA